MGIALGGLWVVGMVKICEGEVVEVVDLLGLGGLWGGKGKERGGICTSASTVP